MYVNETYNANSLQEADQLVYSAYVTSTHVVLWFCLFCFFFCIFFIASLVDLHLTGNVILIAGIFYYLFFLKK